MGEVKAGGRAGGVPPLARVAAGWGWGVDVEAGLAGAAWAVWVTPAWTVATTWVRAAFMSGVGWGAAVCAQAFSSSKSVIASPVRRAVRFGVETFVCMAMILPYIGPRSQYRLLRQAGGVFKGFTAEGAEKIFL